MLKNEFKQQQTLQHALQASWKKQLSPGEEGMAINFQVI